MRLPTIALPLVLVCLPALIAAPLRPSKAATERDEARKHLKELAEYLATEVNDGKDPPPSPTQALEGLLAYVKKQKDGDPVRKEALALAKKYAVVPNRKLGVKIRPGEANQITSRLEIAWKLLRETDVLRSGMTVEQASAVLGPPTQTEEGLVYWESVTNQRLATMLIGVLSTTGVIAEFKGLFNDCVR